LGEWNRCASFNGTVVALGASELKLERFWLFYWLRTGRDLCCGGKARSLLKALLGVKQNMIMTVILMTSYQSLVGKGETC